MKLNFRRPSLDLGSVEIESVRLHLCPLSRAFAQDIFEGFTPEITKYMMPKPATEISETVAFIEEALMARAQCTDLHLVICQRYSQEFLGICGLHGRENPAQPELGIWLKRSAHGYRYGFEAIEALVSWATDNLHCDCLIYPVDRENVASGKIPQSLGADILQERKVENMSGRILDEVVYRIPLKSAGKT